jgi:hypothetical protein
VCRLTLSQFLSTLQFQVSQLRAHLINNRGKVTVAKRRDAQAQLLDVIESR